MPLSPDLPRSQRPTLIIAYLKPAPVLNVFRIQRCNELGDWARTGMGRGPKKAKPPQRGARNFKPNSIT